MKHHLYVLLIALRVLVVVIAFAAIGQFLYAYSSFTDPEEANRLIRSTFRVVAPKSPVPDEYVGYYFIVYGLLLCYLVYALVMLYRSFIRLHSGDVFYDRQAMHFKQAGAGIIIFAKCNYLLHCAFGAICFRDITSFLSEIPLFLGLYLGGKVILVLYYMAEKGTVLREETDLTI
jgi:hypothetical protein